MEVTNKIPLVNDTGKIILGQTLNRFQIILKIVIIWALIMLYDFFLSDIVIDFTLFMFIEVILILLPFIVPIIYIHMTKICYVIFFDDHADICTKVSKKTFYYNSTLKVETKNHCLSKLGSKADYYSVWLTFEEDFEQKKVFFYTDDLALIDIVTVKYRLTT